MTDTIIARYLHLSRVQNIPDVRAYAADWYDLAALALADNRPFAAESYKKRGDFYMEQAQGEYIRIIEDSFSQLIPVDVPKDYIIGDSGLG